MLGGYPDYLNREKAVLQQRFLHKIKSMQKWMKATEFDEVIMSEKLDYHTFEWYGGVDDKRQNYFTLGTGHRDFYKKGDQIFHSYGHHDSATLMKRYGFTLRENKYDNYKIKVVGVNQETGEYEQKPITIRRNRLCLEWLSYLRWNLMD